MKAKDKELKIRETKEKNQKIAEETRSVKELLERIAKEKKELQELYMQKVRFTLKNTSALRIKRDQIARLLTIVNRLKTINK